MEAHLHDLKRFGQADIGFHLAIAAGAGHALFQKILHSMLPTLGIRFAIATYADRASARENLRDHKQISRSIKKCSSSTP